MTIFISYSHIDKNIVDTLATHMVRRNAQVWVDRWELNVGDSIVQRVQDAITDSDALLVVLSKASVNSEWCKKELNTGPECVNLFWTLNAKLNYFSHKAAWEN